MDLFVSGGLDGIFLWFHQRFAGRFQANLAPMLTFLRFLLRIRFSVRHRTTTPISYQFGLQTIYARDCAMWGRSLNENAPHLKSTTYERRSIIK
jgi:hypothetical protein